MAFALFELVLGTAEALVLIAVAALCPRPVMVLLRIVFLDLLTIDVNNLSLYPRVTGCVHLGSLHVGVVVLLFCLALSWPFGSASTAGSRSARWGTASVS